MIALMIVGILPTITQPVVDDGDAWDRVEAYVPVLEGTVVSHQGRGLLDVGDVWLSMTWLQDGDDVNLIEIQIQPNYPEGATGAGYVAVRPMCQDESGNLTSSGSTAVFEWDDDNAIYGPPAQTLEVTGTCGIGEHRVWALAGSFADGATEQGQNGVLPPSYQFGWLDQDHVITMPKAGGTLVYTMSITDAPNYGDTAGAVTIHLTKDVTGCPNAGQLNARIWPITSGTIINALSTSTLWGGSGCPNLSMDYTWNLPQGTGGFGYMTVYDGLDETEYWYPNSHPSGEGGWDATGDLITGAVVLEDDWVESFRYDPVGAIAVEEIPTMCTSFGECVSRCDIGWEWNVGQVVAKAINCLVVPTISFQEVVSSLPDLSDAIVDLRLVVGNLASGFYATLSPGECGELATFDMSGLGATGNLVINTCDASSFTGTAQPIINVVVIFIVTIGCIGIIVDALGFALRWDDLGSKVMRYFGFATKSDD